MATPSNKDYYELLGVAKDASAEDIKKAFRTKARTMHPDVNKEPGAEERFKEISEAYDTLSDPEKRSRYDMVRAGGFAAGSPFTGTPGGSWRADPRDPFGWGSWGSPFSGGYSSAYERARSASGVPYVAKEGATRKIVLELSRDEARKGCSKTVSYAHMESCPTCRGKGYEPGGEPVSCEVCKGSGRIEANMGGLFVTQMACPACAGSGRVLKTPCSACQGSGTHQRKTTTTVTIPAGSHDGDTVRVPAAGDAGRCGGATGDLRVDVSVPSEHLTPQQESLFTIVGVAASVMLCFFFSGIVMRVLSVLAFPLMFVFFFASPALLRPKSGGSFVKRAGRRFAMGLLVGLFVYVIFVLPQSCMRF